MINGFSGMGLNELVGALSRSKYGQQSPPRDIQPMPKMDTVQFSSRGVELATSTEATRPAAPDKPISAERPTGAEKPAGPANEMSMMDRMKAAFFTSEGDKRFDASVDLNRDGKVNNADLAAMRHQTSPADKLSVMDRMKAAFFTGEGDEGFDASVDLNADGRINAADLAVLHKQDRPEGPGDMLQHMRSAFFSQAGDEGFDAGMDLNSDGAINLADLAMLHAKLEGGVNRQPAGPLTPAAPEPVVEQNPAAVNPVIDDQGATLDAMRSAFFSSSGDAAYTAAADVNGDGRINFADLAQLRSE